MSAEMSLRQLLPYVQHKYNCDWLQPMWHQGPCDCGLAELVVALTPEEQITASVSKHVSATIEAATLRAARKGADSASERSAATDDDIATR